MSLITFFDEIYFDSEFDFKEYQEHWSDGKEGQDAERFKIKFDYNGCGELEFNLSIMNPKNKNKSVIAITLGANESIKLYHLLKKDIEEIKTRNDLKFLLDNK